MRETVGEHSSNYNFKEMELRDFAIFKNGKLSPQRDDRFGFPVFGSNGIIGYSEIFNSDEETIIIGRVGSYCGSVYFSDKKCWITDNALIVRAKQNCNPKFLFYLLKKLNLNNHRSGSGQPLLNQDILNSIRTIVPSLSEQKIIGSILFSLDDKIGLNCSMNITIESIGQALFKHWFVDFEFPNEGGKPYRSSGGEMVETDLGEVPSGWRVDLITEVADVVDCLHIKKPMQTEKGPILLQLYNVGDYGLLDFKELYHVSQEDYKVWTKNIQIKEGDCILTNAGLAGAIAQIPYGFEVGLGRNITAVRPIKITPAYLIRYLFSEYGKKEIQKNLDVGTIFNSLNVKGIRKVNMLIPDQKIMYKFETLARQFRKAMEKNVYENLCLSEIRDALLPKLMSGEIRVNIESLRQN